VFFENEFRAAAAAPASVGIDEIIRLDLTSLPLIRRQLGIGGTLCDALRFVVAVVRRKGVRYLSRLSIPLLAWLLYKTFCELLHERQLRAIVTTNMQHPASIAVHRAARKCGQAALFHEHATTPSLVFSDRGYERLFVNFEHTRRMMIARGAAPEKVQVLGTLGVRRVEPPSQLRTVGICINDLDSPESVEAVTAELQRRGLAVSYRLHDADPRLGYFRERAGALGLGFSSARASRIGEYLGSVDLVVAGNSNVVADALLAGKPVVYYWPGADELFDYYGFVGYYELPHARNLQALAAVLGELQSQSSQAC